MEREQIEKEAYSRLDEAENQWDGIFNSGYSRGFMSGAQWRINSVWHDASERPEIGRNLLTYFGSKYCEIDCLRKEDFDWEYYADKRGIVRWAYIEDLLPDGKEEAE